MILIFYRIVSSAINAGMFTFYSLGLFKNSPRLFFKKTLKKKYEPQSLGVWFHASSVGELNILKNVLPEYKQKYKTHKVLISTFTSSSFKIAQKIFHGDVVILFPIEVTLFYSNIVKFFCIKKMIITETEIWPLLFYQLHKLGVDVELINAVISDKTYRRYKIFKNWLNLFAVKRVITKGEVNAFRFIDIGIDKARVFEGTDLKNYYMFKSYDKSFERAKKNISSNDLIGLFVSLRQSEEEIFLAACEACYRIFVVPRHPEKSLATISALCTKNNLSFCISTDVDKDYFNFGSHKIIIVNQFGVMDAYYKLADFAVVGGTFIDAGGHNIMEPIQYSIPVIYGPSVYKQKESHQLLYKFGAGIQVEDSKKLKNIVAKIREDGVFSKEIRTNQKILLEKISEDFRKTVSLI